MSIEMPEGEWKQATPDFHPDPSKEVDPVESLIEKHGFEGAVDEILEQLKQTPTDPELRRRASLIMNRCDDLAAGLRDKLSH